jgi:hypothetical protein
VIIHRIRSRGGLTGPAAVVLPTPLTFVGFSALSPLVLDGGEWSSGEKKGIRDNVTGDLCQFRWTSADNAFVLFTSQNNGATWSRVATDVSNPDGTTPDGFASYQYPNALLSVAQDSTGAVHGLCSGKAGNDRYYYLRFTLTRSSGHVTGFSLARSPFSFVYHARNGATDYRGNIYVIKRGGVERVLFLYGMPSAADQTSVYVYSGVSTTLTPSTQSDFTALDGTASADTLVFSQTVSDYQINHLCEGGMCQIGSTEDIFFFFGPLDADAAIGQRGADPTVFSLFSIRFTKSGGNWSQGSPVDVVTYSGTDTVPTFLDCRGTSDKAWVMYIHGTLGVSFSYFDASGTLHANAVTSPLSTSNKSGMGCFTVAEDGKIWTVFHTIGFYAGSSTPIVGKLGYWNGTTWNLQNDPTAVYPVSISGVDNWASGCCAMRINVDPVTAQVTTIDIAAVYGTA